MYLSAQDLMRDELHEIMFDEHSQINMATKDVVRDFSLTIWKILRSHLHSMTFLHWNNFINKCSDRDEHTTLKIGLGKYVRLESCFANEHYTYNKKRLGLINFCGFGCVAIHLILQVNPNQS